MNLTRLSLPLRVLFTGYLVVVGLGLCMSATQLLLTHGMADGELGLSVEDVVYSYHGDRGGSTLEAKLKGSMRDKAPTEARADIVRWIQTGSPREAWDQDIGATFAEHCVRCHGTIAGLPSFTTYEGVKPYAEIDEGATIDSLARVSHIHLFGIAFIFFFVAGIFSMTVRVPPWLKASVIGLPFLALVLDVGAWWMTKWYPSFAYVTIAGGSGYNLAGAFMILTSLYQMWVMKPSGEDPWTRDET
ncbi:MAG TPA: elongation factor-1 alpha [Myxococcota bacterium]|nr:elongation factor-1 alpha [Myxococcota bacterium]